MVQKQMGVVRCVAVLSLMLTVSSCKGMEALAGAKGESSTNSRNTSSRRSSGVRNLAYRRNMSISGKVDNGRQIPLDWAASSQVACFPATRFVEYRGNHVFYKVTLPANVRSTISVTPTSGKRINVYTLDFPPGQEVMPPRVKRAKCEASYPRYVGNPNLRNAGGKRSVEVLAYRNPRTVIIGVAGAKTITRGSFRLDISSSGI